MIQYLKETKSIPSHIYKIMEAEQRARGGAWGPEQGPGGTGNLHVVDPRVWMDAGFGRQIARRLNTGDFKAMVTDFGKVVTVKVTYHNIGTGKEVSKDFAVVFDDRERGSGNVMVSSTRWRSISSPDQAVTYIQSFMASARNNTNSI